MSETRADVFEAVLRELQDWKWERWTGGTAAEFQARLDENSREWRARFDAADCTLDRTPDDSENRD